MRIRPEEPFPSHIPTLPHQKNPERSCSHRRPTPAIQTSVTEHPGSPPAPQPRPPASPPQARAPLAGPAWRDPAAGSREMAPLGLRPTSEAPGRRPGLRVRPRRIPATPGRPAAAIPGPGAARCPRPAASPLRAAAPRRGLPARAHLLDVVEAREHADAPVVEDGELLRQLLLTGLQHGARHGAGRGAAAAAAGLLAPGHRPAAAATAPRPPPLPPATSASGQRAHGPGAPIRAGDRASRADACGSLPPQQPAPRQPPAFRPPPFRPHARRAPPQPPPSRLPGLLH